MKRNNAWQFSGKVALRSASWRPAKVIFFTTWLVALTLGEASGLEFSTNEIAGKRVTVCRVDLHSDRLQLFHRDESGQPYRNFERLSASLQSRGQKLIWGMNAGMYHADLSTVGLFVSDGTELTPLNTTNGTGNFFLKPNGVFLVSNAGARIVESSEYANLREQVIIATQSGPLLVREGKIHPAFKPESQSRLIRNGVGVSSPHIVFFAITDSPVNFHEFATMFRDTLHCTNALYFDGVISSLYAPKLNRNDSKKHLGPIIGVTE